VKRSLVWVPIAAVGTACISRVYFLLFKSYWKLKLDTFVGLLHSLCLRIQSTINL